MNPRILYLTLLLAIFPALPALADEAYEYDPDIGEEINEVCAGCHGEYAKGGKEGEYPRLAGQPAKFIAEQLRLFRARKRKNMPMLPHTEERELPDEDIFHISTYISKIELAKKLPPIEDEEDFDPYERLILAEKTFNVGRVEGDIKKGEKSYKRECRSCHGDDGWGDEEDGVPMLAGQYTNYLWLQVKKLRNKQRIHDRKAPDEELLSLFSDEELQNIFAYLSTVDDKEDEEEED